MNRGCLLLSTVLMLVGTPAGAGQAPFAAGARISVGGATGSTPPSRFPTPSR